MPHDVEICLFRIVQEGLNNVVKHSGARQAQVTLRGTADVLALSILDSGRGFDKDSSDVPDGLGLASMRERLRLIQGELSIRSQPGQGTTIVASVPIPRVGSSAEQP
jgi:signal transduction histidine kinase